MTRLMIVAVLCFGLAGCGGPGEKAEQSYKIVERTGTSSEKCAAMKKVVDAWLEEGDQKKYEEQKLRRDMECLEAQLDQKAGRP